MDGSSYLSTGFLDTEEILDLKLVDRLVLVWQFALGLVTRTCMVAYGCHSKINNCLSIFIVYFSILHIFF